MPLVRLLSMAVTVALRQLHEELRREGHGTLRPTHGYALNAVLNGRNTTSQIAPAVGMTKQGAAKLVQTLLEEGYLTIADADAEDARVKALALTDRGREAIAASVRIQERIEAEWAALVGPRRMASARRALDEAVRRSSSGELPAVRLDW